MYYIYFNQIFFGDYESCNRRETYKTISTKIKPNTIGYYFFFLFSWRFLHFPKCHSDMIGIFVACWILCERYRTQMERDTMPSPILSFSICYVYSIHNAMNYTMNIIGTPEKKRTIQTWYFFFSVTWVICF